MTSSPLWRGGGRIFPNMPDENFSQKINKKMYRAGMASIFSQLAREGRVAVVESIKVDSPKTKALAAKFKAMNLESVLVIAEEVDENLYLASRNLVNVLVVEPRYADPVSLVHYKKVLVTKAPSTSSRRCSHEPHESYASAASVRRGSSDERAGRTDRVREGHDGRREVECSHFQGAAGRHQARDQGGCRTDVQGRSEGRIRAQHQGQEQALWQVGRPPRQRSQGYVTLKAGQELNLVGEGA